MASGGRGTITFYAVQFYQKQHKIVLDYSRFLLIISFFFHYLFRVFHLGYGHMLTLLMQAALVVFLILYIKEVLFPSQEKVQEVSTTNHSFRKNLLSLRNGFATICISIGSLFKILHWEFGLIHGDILLIVGLSAIIFSTFAGSRDVEG